MLYRLMIVDDEESTREGLMNYVDWESMGFTVAVSFIDGREAVKYLETGSEDINVVLTDVRMTFVSGVELAKVIYESYPQIYVVFLSGYKEFEYAKQGMAYGVIEYLIKPTQLKELRSVFAKIKQRLDKDTHKNVSSDKEPLSQNSAENTILSEQQENTDIQKAVLYINENYRNECTLIDVAEHLNLAPSYFSRLFKLKTGINFSDYLIKVRVQKAIELLQNTTMKVHEISGEVGYVSHRHFSRVFKRETGCLPTEYKNQR